MQTHILIAPLVKRRLRADIGPGLAEALIAHLYGVPLEELRAVTRRGARVAFARQVLMYLTHVALRLSITEVAAIFGRDRSTASHACHRIEDLRDNPHFDRQLSQLENVLHEAISIEVLD